MRARSELIQRESPGREQLIQTLAELARDHAAPPLVVVTHHLDEIPPGFTHALLLASGQISAAGPIEEVLTPERLSICFGLALPAPTVHQSPIFTLGMTVAAAPT